MLVELRNRSQITIPAEITKRLGVTQGDKFEIYEKDGCICLMPVVVYPKQEMERISALLKEADIESAQGRTKVYGEINELFNDLGIAP